MCSHTAAPGAEVFSISVPSPDRPNLKPPVPTAPPFPLFLPHLCSVLAACLRNVYPESRKWASGADAGPRSQGPWGCCTLSALLEFAPTPTPSPLGPGASVHCQSMSPMCWKHPCLSSFLHPHLRYSFRREEIPPCVSSKPQDLAQCLAHSRSQQMWAETFSEDGPMEP